MSGEREALARTDAPKARSHHREPGVYILRQRSVTDGDQSTPRWELHRAREMAATLIRVQQQTARLHEAVRAVAAD